MGDIRQANTINMKVLMLLALLGACAAWREDSYNAPSNSYNAPSIGSLNAVRSRGNSGYSSGAGFNSGFSGSGLSYSSGGSNSGFSSSRGGSFGFSNGNSGFGGYGFSNGNNGVSGFDSSRTYGRVIHVGGNQNSGYGSNSGSSGFGGGSSFIAADNGFNSGYGGSNGGNSGRIFSLGGSGNSRIY